MKLLEILRNIRCENHKHFSKNLFLNIKCVNCHMSIINHIGCLGNECKHSYSYFVYPSTNYDSFFCFNPISKDV